MRSDRELRFAGAELHAGPGNVIEGLAAPFNRNSRPIPGVGIERILPSAFDASLRRAEQGEQDVLMNANHLESMLLGSYTMGNLDLHRDSSGLHFRVKVPSHSSYGMAVVDAVREGTLSGCSFSFSPMSEGRASDGARELRDVYLHHLTVCKPSLAAYPDAGAEARTSAEFASYRTIGTYFDIELRAVKFLVVENDGTKHLPVTDESGKPDHHLMGAAWAALMDPNGFRGKRYEGPDKQKAISKLKAMYRAEGLPIPSESGRMLQLDAGDPMGRYLMDRQLHSNYLRLGGESRIYTAIDQVPPYVPQDARKQWMDIWNSTFKAAKAKGLSDKVAEGKAFAEANGVIKKEMARN